LHPAGSRAGNRSTTLAGSEATQSPRILRVILSYGWQPLVATPPAVANAEPGRP
jgi:hypothetical protein